MKLRNQKFTVLFALMFAAMLALPAVYSLGPGTVKAGGQAGTKSDVKTPAKTKST